MKILEPKYGSIGVIKAPHAVKTTGVTLYHPDFEEIYNSLDKNHRISAAFTAKFDYRWEYIKEEDSYLLHVKYYYNNLEFGVKFPRNKAGQILQKLVQDDQMVVTYVLKFKEGSKKLFDDAVVLMGVELEILPGSDWPSK
ncbi:MAG: hypothetical protein H0Z40_07065 [Desulfotomaculum sp.]|nr:hypothetical protein [Desulfotomaculum sp.]